MNKLKLQRKYEKKVVFIIYFLGILLISMILFSGCSKQLDTIVFNSNGGSQVKVITANYNSVITAPTKEGYTFAGWYSEIV